MSGASASIATTEASGARLNIKALATFATLTGCPPPHILAVTYAGGTS